MTSSRTAAAPRSALARRVPRLMLPAPCTAAGRAPKGWGTVGGPSDDPRELLPAAARVQGQRSTSPQLPVRR